jgi:hypothetical protein
MKEQLMIVIIGTPPLKFQQSKIVVPHLDFNLIELSKRLKYFEIEIKPFPQQLQMTFIID